MKTEKQICTDPGKTKAGWLKKLRNQRGCCLTVETTTAV